MFSVKHINRPSTSRYPDVINKAYSLIMKNYQLIVWEIANEIRLVVAVEHDFNKWIGHKLSGHKICLQFTFVWQRVSHLDIAHDKREYVNGDSNSLKTLTTVDVVLCV